MAKEQFFYRENEKHLQLLDEAARQSGVSRGQAFEDLLEMSVCALSGGVMEEQYLAVVKKHSDGKKGKRGVDTLAELFGRLVNSMEDTQNDIKDVLGDLFVGSISYGEGGQYFSPEPICRMMANLTVGEVSDDPQHETKVVSDPCCGSGRMLLAVAELQRHWIFVGQDIDLRCVRMTGINLALRNLYGYVVWGNTFKNEQRLVYHIGLNLRGFIREANLDECPQPVQQAVSAPAEDVVAKDREVASDNPTEKISTENLPIATKQLRLF